MRTLLVPATMRLLGAANWYLPSWLHWLPDLRVEKSPHTPSEAMAGGGAGGGGGRSARLIGGLPGPSEAAQAGYPAPAVTS